MPTGSLQEEGTQTLEWEYGKKRRWEVAKMYADGGFRMGAPECGSLRIRRNEKLWKCRLGGRGRWWALSSQHLQVYDFIQWCRKRLQYRKNQVTPVAASNFCWMLNLRAIYKQICFRSFPRGSLNPNICIHLQLYGLTEWRPFLFPKAATTSSLP